MKHVWVINSKEFDAYTIVYIEGGDMCYQMVRNHIPIREGLNATGLSLPVRVHYIDEGGESELTTIK